MTGTSTNTTTMLFDEVEQASSNATAAREAVAAAVQSATEAARMLPSNDTQLALAAGGDSMAAMMRAQGILDAQEAAAQAVRDAEAALADLEMARTEAMAVADDHPHKAALLDTIDNAIIIVEAQIRVITSVRDGTALANAVMKVTGAGGTGTPQSFADRVAGLMDASFNRLSSGQGSVIQNPSNPPPAGTAPAVRYDDQVDEEETLFAKYGWWLTDAGSNEIRINVYACVGALCTCTDTTDCANTKSTLGSVPDLTTTTLTDTSATYRGEAVGMAARGSWATLNSGGTTAFTGTSSGAFTADVELTATFGSAPMLGGTIDNFRSENGDAVNPNWSVELVERAFDGSFDINDSGDRGQTLTSQGAAWDAVWGATAYGSTGARPTGIFGQFNAYFEDGGAAGAYTTRKEEE